MTSRLDCNRDSACSWRERRAYTLLELVIVMTILVSLGALAWPRVQPLLQRAVLTQAGLQLKEDLAAARENAVRRGEVWELRCRPGSSQYTVGPKRTAATRGSLELTVQPSSGFQPVVGEAPRELTRELTRELPDDVSFPAMRHEPRSTLPPIESRAMPDHHGAGPRDAGVELASEPHQSGWMALAEFLPNGRATAKTIRLVRTDLPRSIELRLRGLTGTVQIGPVRNDQRFNLENGQELRKGQHVSRQHNPHASTLGKMDGR